MSHLITYPGIAIGFLLILWGIIPKLCKTKGRIKEEGNSLTPNFKVEYYEGESGLLSLDVLFNNRPLDLTLKTMAMMVKEEDVTIISKSDVDFDKTYAKKGRVSVLLTHNDLSRVGSYKGQIQVNYPSGEIRKTDPFDFEILPSIISKVRHLTTVCAIVSATSEPNLEIKSEVCLDNIST